MGFPHLSDAQLEKILHNTRMFDKTLLLVMILSSTVPCSATKYLTLPKVIFFTDHAEDGNIKIIIAFNYGN